MLGDGAVRQEHRLVVRRQRIDVAEPVDLLVGARLLVLPDHVRVVLVDGGAGHQSGLAVLARPLLVHVEARLGVRNEDAAAHQLREVVPPLRVDRAGVLVDPLRQVDLGARNPQETVGVAAAEGARLPRRDGVVRRRRNPGGERRRRPERAKWEKGDHGEKTIL